MFIQNYIFPIINFLIIAMPFFLVSGSFLPDLACVLISLFYLYYLLKINNFQKFNNIFFYYLLAIYFYINFNSFFSFNPKISFETSLTFIRVIIFVIALSFFFNSIHLKKNFLFSTFVCLLILLIDSLYQFFTTYNLIGYKQLDPDRVTSFFGKEQIMGSFISRLLPMNLAILILLNLKKENLLTFLLLIASGVLVFLSGERLAFVYFFITLIFCFIFNFKKNIVFHFILFFSFITILLISYNPKQFNRIFLHTYSQFKETNKISNLSYRHSLHYKTAYNMFLDNKIIGHGLKSFRNLCGDSKFSTTNQIIDNFTFLSPGDGIFHIYETIYNGDNVFILELLNNLESQTKPESLLQPEDRIRLAIVDKSHFLKIFVMDFSVVKKDQKIYATYQYSDGCNTHPHNIYLQFLAELGLVGFILFFIIFLYFSFILLKLIIVYFKNNKNFNRNLKARSFLILGILLSMFPLFPSGNYFGNWLLIITYLPFGLYLSLIKSKND